jgi:hypothetical protein
MHSFMRFDPASRRSWWLDAGLVWILAAILVLPLFKLKYLNNWPSIEATFVADGRMLQENWPHHLWQPLWYCGTRADYVYPPGLRSGVAIISTLIRSTQARAYHLFIGLFYSFGMVAVYLWARTATSSRGVAWLAALGTALLSPCLWVLPDLKIDSGFLVPWRLHVLMKYGEGPHISSLSVLPLAWLGAWRRFRGGDVRWLCLASAASALVVTLNFYGATALAISLPLAAWSCFLEKRDWWIFRDFAFVAALAYGLTAWWLVPSYLAITTRNLQLVAPKGNDWSLPVLSILLVAYVVSVSFRARRLRHFSPYTFFIWSGFGFLAAYTLGYRWFQFQVAGSSLRLLPELDLFAILCGVQLVNLLWTRPQLVPRLAAVLLIVVSFVPSKRYIRHAYFEFPKDNNWWQRVEYKTSAWLSQHFPDARVQINGTIRFWYNAWSSGQQADGGSEQGLLNPVIPRTQWLINAESDPDLALYSLQALGVDLVVISGPKSQEPYKDVAHPEMYAAHFPLLRDDGEDNRYYQVPRRTAGIVRVVDRARVKAVRQVPAEFDKAQVGAYAAAIEAAPPGGVSDRARGRWRGSDAFDAEVDIREGESLLIQETYDPYWRAYADGRARHIQRDPLGFMLVELPPGQHSVRLEFATPLEVTIGRLLSIGSILLVITLVWRRSGNRRPAP